MLSHEQLNDLRQRVLNGEDVTEAEYRELIIALRSKRSGDVATSAEKKASISSKAKSPKPTVDLPDIFKDI